MNKRVRRNLLRIILCAALVVFGFFLRSIGMYHSVVLDNSELSRNGVVMSPVEGARLVSEKEPVDIAPDDRVLLSVKGPTTTLVFESAGPEGGSPRQTSYPLSLGSKKMVILSVPALVNGDKDPVLAE